MHTGNLKVKDHTACGANQFKYLCTCEISSSSAIFYRLVNSHQQILNFETTASDGKQVKNEDGLLKCFSFLFPERTNRLLEEVCTLILGNNTQLSHVKCEL